MLLRKTIVPALILILLFSTACCAQRYDDPKELLEIAPSADEYPNAGYAYLIDEARHTIKPDGSWTLVTRIAARIFNERGRGAANVHLSYNSAFESMKVIRARTIKPDGSVMDVKRDEIREISPYSGYAMYSSIKSKVMIMPAVEDNCVIDYEWEVSGKQSIMPGHLWEAWYFQSREPTLLSRFTLQVPTSLDFRHQAYNTRILPRVIKSRDGRHVTYVWEGRDFDGVESEPHMPPLSEICPWFELSSVKSWQEVGLWYAKLIEPRMKSTPEIRNAVAELTKDKHTACDKARTIFYWVEDRIRYVGLEFGASAYEPHTASEVFNNRYGDCKDQATLLVTMLREAGIKAYPVLASVGVRGEISKRLPSPGVFDHAIAVAEIDGERIWMDTTAEVCPFGELPESVRGREVLIIRDLGGEFVKTPAYTVEDNFTSQSAEITLDSGGGISALVKWTASGGDGYSARMSYKYARPSQIEEGFQATVAAVSAGARLINYSFSDPNRRDDRMSISYEFEAADWANRTQKFLIFRPSLYQSVLSQTPFSKQERNHAVVFPHFASNASETILNLPEGFVVEEVPWDVALKSDFAEYERTHTLEDGRLKIVENLVRKEARVPAARYAEVKKFYEDAISAQKRQVVLRVVENTAEDM